MYIYNIYNIHQALFPNQANEQNHYTLQSSSPIPKPCPYTCRLIASR